MSSIDRKFHEPKFCWSWKSLLVFIYSILRSRSYDFLYKFNIEQALPECHLIVLYFTFLQDINRKRIAQISCSFVKDNQIEFQGVKVCKHLISLLMETNRPSATRLRSRVCLWLCCFVPLSQGKMKQGDFWTALLQNTKRLPPRSVPHQLRAYGTHFPSQ